MLAACPGRAARDSSCSCFLERQAGKGKGEGAEALAALARVQELHSTRAEADMRGESQVVQGALVPWPGTTLHPRAL